MTTHDRIQPVSGAHENLGHVALPAEPSAQVVDRPPARPPARLPACHYCTHSCLVPACLLLRRSSAPRPALSSHSLLPRAHASQSSLFSLSLSLLPLLLLLLLFLSLSHEELLLLPHPIPISRCCIPLHVCFFFLAFQLSFWHVFFFFFFSFRRNRSLCQLASFPPLWHFAVEVVLEIFFCCCRLSSSTCLLLLLLLSFSIFSFFLNRSSSASRTATFVS